MNTNVNIWTVIITAVGGTFAYLFGPWDALIIGLICAVCMDYITGVIAAAVKNELSSGIGFKGLLKKIVIFLILALAALVDKAVPATSGAVRSTVCLFYITNEGLSIIENACCLGIPIPEILKKALLRHDIADEDSGHNE